MNKENLYYLCVVIGLISEKTGLSKGEVAERLGDEGLNHIYRFADTYHCLPVEQAIDEIMEDFGKSFEKMGTQNQNHRNIGASTISVWDISNVYARLIIDETKDNWISVLKNVFHSWLVSYIDDPELPIYYQSRGYIKACYEEGMIL